MTNCSRCDHEISGDARFCPMCGTTVNASTVTELEAPAPGSTGPGFHADAIRHGRFLPGTMLTERYRIVQLLGQGGMGEVYRADDLKLGQTLALKFLRKGRAGDSSRLARLLNEVRVARQVTHPNVCRIYDVGEFEGESFITMEYVRGENLAELLRRIGRLPPEKAEQISRQVCSGLAAAHAKRVLHRDLKPGNILIDEHGVARITDFGLAGFAEDFSGERVREGTPAYMAPEQRAGREVSVQSDIYSLGLILYELFTGRQVPVLLTMPELVAEGQYLNAGQLPGLSDLKPSVERVILRCLEAQPYRRPASAVAVAVTLPGGNPLSEPLAAGETPPPEIVAAVELEGLHPPAAAASLLALVVAMALVVTVSGETTLLRYVPLDYPPEVLANMAREVVKRLAYTETPADYAQGFEVDQEYIRHVRETDASVSRWEKLATLQPPAIRYWYRQGSHYLSPTDGFAVNTVTRNDPVPILSGMVDVALDPRGRLVSFRAVPPQLDPDDQTPREVDWSSLFAVAGLDVARFRSVRPRWIPLAFADTRQAWEGTYPERPDLPLRVEAAAYRGRPIAFELISPWTRAWRMQPVELQPGERVYQVSLVVLLLALLVGGMFVARRNVRAGRGDRQGAARLAAFVAAVTLLSWLLLAHHVPTVRELGLFVGGINWSLFVAGLIWLLYTAVEPYVRRRWPVILVSWARLLQGSFRDALVGRDLLLGVLLGTCTALGARLYQYLLPRWLGLPPSLSGGLTGATPVQASDLRILLGGRYLVGQALSVVPFSILVGLGMTFLLLLYRAVLRWEWLGAAAFILVSTLLSASYAEHPLVSAALAALVWTGMIMVLIRLGLLALVVLWTVLLVLQGSPLTVNLSSWYASTGVLVVMMVVGVGVFGFYATLGGRPLLRRDPLEA